MATPTPLVLDCDPGHDDAVALLVAGASEVVDLRAVTTVAGNQTLDKTTLNACRVLSTAGLTDVPVAAGAASPLLRPLRVADDIHGESGLDGPDWRDPEVRPSDLGAVELLRRTLTAADEPVTVVATGPLTNVAALLTAHPDVVEAIREISWMGGSTARGNVTPLAEFNAAVDPEAARIVLRSGVPVTMCGLDVTHRALATEPVVARLRALDAPLGGVTAELLTFFATTYRSVFGFDAPPLHDPVAVARVIDPNLVGTVRANVEVECEGRWTSGATVTDLDGSTGREPTVDVATELDVPGFWELVVESVARCGHRT